jgi:ABC-type nitrate/sulfonate/bicarbonate transport system ATPase subunit
MRAQVDLTVRRGEFVCLIGPSGWGKTALIRVIADLHEQVSELRLLANNGLSRPDPQGNRTSLPAGLL